MALILLAVLAVTVVTGVAVGVGWSRRTANNGRSGPCDEPRPDAFESLVAAVLRRKRRAALTVILWATAAGLTTIDPVFEPLPHVFQRQQSAILFGILAGGLLFAGSFAVTVAHRARRREAWALTAALALGCVVLIGRVGNDYSPVTLMPPRLAPDGSVLQSHGATCAAASLANLVLLRGGRMSEREAVDLLGTTTSGTSCGQIQFALKRLGIGYRTPARSEWLDQVGDPAFLFIDHPATGPESHAVLLVGASPSSYEILDPLTGRERWNEATARSRWHGSAIACP